MIASTKHFLADGGTKNGVDQGDADISEQDLRDIHGLPYGPAIEGGVATVMVSYSSWQGRKMLGNKSLLTGTLKGQMDFEGFVISDWNGHGQVEGCTNMACPQAVNAGLDMYMAPDSWRSIYESLLADVKDGRVPMSRIDDAVTRILTVKGTARPVQRRKTVKPVTRWKVGRTGLTRAPRHRSRSGQEVARAAEESRRVAAQGRGAIAGRG